VVGELGVHQLQLTAERVDLIVEPKEPAVDALQEANCVTPGPYR